MPDGMSGLSLSEMGIAVKKAGKAAQKAGTGVVQQVAQQITGQAPVQNPGGTPKSEPVFETDDSGNPLGFFQTAAKQVTGSADPASPQQSQTPPKPEPQYYTDDGGNPLDLLGGALQQVKGSDAKPKSPATQSSQQPQQGEFVMPKHATSEPPSEVSPKQASGFDTSSFLGGQDIFDSFSVDKQPVPQAPSSLEQEFAKQKVEDEQKIEKLRNQLHQMYYDEFVKKSEGKNQKKEETVQEKLEREQREEDEKKMKELEEKKKKAPITPASVQGRQGAHEGLKKQG